MENHHGFFTAGSSALSAAAALEYGGFHGGKGDGLSGLIMEQMRAPDNLNVIFQNGSFVHENNKLVKITETKMETKKGEKKVRNPRFAFQTRSQVDILDDGYRWRKYGQKAVKNNKFPRSYYRCTHQGCSVKKQIQRLTKDEGIVVTTYEGMHSHPIQKSNDNFEHILSQMQIYTNQH